MTPESREEAVRAASFIIVAQGDNGAIGAQGSIPWRHSADMRHFRNATLGCTLLVGRTTYDSLPPTLPGRDVVVVTSRPLTSGASALSAPDVASAIRIATDETSGRGIAFAGGPRIYQEALSLPWLRRALVTKIRTSPEADAFMPGLGPEWRVERSWPLASKEGEPEAEVVEMSRHTS